jgi:hypothetical protein
MFIFCGEDKGRQLTTEADFDCDGRYCEREKPVLAVTQLSI